MGRFLENLLERAMFASRWVLSPIYIVLSLTLFLIMIKVIQEFMHEIVHLFEMNINQLLVFVLHILLKEILLIIFLKLHQKHG